MKTNIVVLTGIACMMVAGCAAQQKKTAAPAAAVVADNAVTEIAVAPPAPAAATLTAAVVTPSAAPVALNIAVATKPSLRVEEALFCAGVKDRVPQGVADTFDASVKKIFFFNRVTGSNQPTSITHVWYWNERKMAEVPLDVRSSNWRTWSSKRIDPSWKGSWAVKVLDANGEILTAKNFEIR